jgi:hypothetical protein
MGNMSTARTTSLAEKGRAMSDPLEQARKYLEAITRMSKRLRAGGADPEDLQELDNGLTKAVYLAGEALDAFDNLPVLKEGEVAVDGEKIHDAVVLLAENGECPTDLTEFNCPIANDEEQICATDTDCCHCWMAHLQRREGEEK